MSILQDIAPNLSANGGDLQGLADSLTEVGDDTEGREGMDAVFVVGESKRDEEERQRKEWEE